IDDANVEVTLVDRRNHHLFQPLLYQVATAALNPSDIAYPIRSVVRRQGNVRVLLAEVVGVDVAGRRVLLADGELAYDYLIVAAGATHSYFGHDDWARRAPGLKSIEDALEIRRKILFAYEAAERETDPALRREWLTFVVVGAGPTGVELAGALAEISRHALERDFRTIDPTQARILLVEGQDRVLPTFDARLHPKAARQLERLGVEIMLNLRVTGIDDRGVTLVPAQAPPGGVPGERRIGARTVLWAAGVEASPLARSLGVPLDGVGRVVVTPELTIPGHDEVFVVGDLAALENQGQPVPGVAPAAMQEGRHAAANILRRIRGDAYLPFRYVDKGMLATIGRAAAVGAIGPFRLSGFLAWATWAFIHLLYLVGFRNRVLVFVEWAWYYVTYQRGARLITGAEKLLPPPG
ncbi:MAG TPA: NAD(P)/FAD-dependent oxidoreductase, partial [Haliangiales bacterium]|nr:NAD(P)/FAD-dependent oxidoreductase [Haliangiales bacterium]